MRAESIRQAPGKRDIMGFLKHLRSKSRLKEKDKRAINGSPAAQHSYPVPARPRADFTKRLPDNVLRIIFGFVCPHSTDESYEPSERSMIGDGCMLCDLRDLANCTRVQRRWFSVGARVLYTSVRIDAVHYCELEEVLAENRRRKSRHGEPIDVPGLRLQLLERTLRENHYLGPAVQLLKLPYMTRETHKATLARTVSCLPNLRYVDLPDGFFNGDPATHTLRQELQARCPDIRKMKYEAGSEQTLEMLLQRYWQNLEILELTRLRIEPTLLRRVIDSLPNLIELRLAELPWLGDNIFQVTPTLPNFPPLRKLALKQIPHITADGLTNYLNHEEIRESLTSLTLENTGVTVPGLRSVMWAASSLQHLTIIESVTQSLPLDPLPPLQSISLQTMHYEITSAAEPFSALQQPSDSYYTYLTQSLLSHSLPALRSLYVRDLDFAENLLLAPPSAPFAAGRPSGPPRGFSQPLEVYAKGPNDEQDWIFTEVTPPNVPGHRGSMSGGRPLSLYSASQGLGSQWGGEARKSIVVGNGFGGFLAVPSEEPQRPRSSGGQSWYRGSGEHQRKGSRADLWR
ncbi:hypothetical protein H2201_005218 [Coniosporium apollinis]|uniref:F-box domain-containing protein n=1 Tax=Coniosporium apollinis TaxID=61459 RepID=A0ABQ9NRC6_9PEZI|nr:hypothetical protein H2201_005218 [Coniosporium apollinis]